MKFIGYIKRKTLIDAINRNLLGFIVYFETYFIERFRTNKNEEENVFHQKVYFSTDRDSNFTTFESDSLDLSYCVDYVFYFIFRLF